MTETQDIALLKRVGEALFGSTYWQFGLAEGLCVNPRTVRRWASGDLPISKERWAEIGALTEKRRADLVKAQAAVTKRLS